MYFSVIKERRLRWTGHILRRSPSHPARIDMEASPLSGWKRKVGGQRKIWTDIVACELSPFIYAKPPRPNELLNWATACLPFAENGGV